MSCVSYTTQVFKENVLICTPTFIEGLHELLTVGKADWIVRNWEMEILYWAKKHL